MKIAQIVYGIAGGGAPNVALTLIDQLTHNGHTVHLVRVNSAYGNNKEETIVKKLNDQRIKNYILHRKPKRIGLFSLFNLIKILNDENYDIIHSHLLIPDIFGAVAAFFSFKKTVHFITVHNTVSYHSPLFLNFFFRRSIFVRCSPAIKEIKSKKKDFVIPNGIDIDKFKPGVNTTNSIKNELNLPVNSILLVSIGNLRKQKNQITGIEMVDIIIKKYCLSDVHFMICGQGDEEIHLKNRTKQLNLMGNIHFLGLREDIPQILHECDYFFNFSLWEGLPLSVIEAYASGITTILSSIDEHRAISKNIPHCHINNDNTAESFALVLNGLLNQDIRLSHFEIFKQREDALKQFSNNTFANSYENLFKKMLHR